MMADEQDNNKQLQDASTHPPTVPAGNVVCGEPSKNAGTTTGGWNRFGVLAAVAAAVIAVAAFFWPPSPAPEPVCAGQQAYEDVRRELLRILVGSEDADSLRRNRQMRADAVRQLIALDRAAIKGYREKDCEELPRRPHGQVNLDRIDLRFAPLYDVNFDDTYVCWVRFDSAMLERARFVGANAKSAVFSGAVCRDTVFFGTSLCGADFSGADISDSDFRWADLSNADFSGATGHPTSIEDAYVHDIRGNDELKNWMLDQGAAKETDRAEWIQRRKRVAKIPHPWSPK